LPEFLEEMIKGEKTYKKKVRGQAWKVLECVRGTCNGCEREEREEKKQNTAEKKAEKKRLKKVWTGWLQEKAKRQFQEETEMAGFPKEQVHPL